MGIGPDSTRNGADRGAALAGWQIFQTQCTSCHAIAGTSATSGSPRT